jgi:hypothetical protein
MTRHKWQWIGRGVAPVLLPAITLCAAWSGSVIASGVGSLTHHRVGGYQGAVSGSSPGLVRSQQYATMHQWSNLTDADRQRVHIRNLNLTGEDMRYLVQRNTNLTPEDRRLMVERHASMRNDGSGRVITPTPSGERVWRPQSLHALGAHRGRK